MTVHSNRSFEVNMLFMSFEINAKCCSITSVVKYDFFYWLPIILRTKYLHICVLLHL